MVVIVVIVVMVVVACPVKCDPDDYRESYLTGLSWLSWFSLLG